MLFIQAPNTPALGLRLIIKQDLIVPYKHIPLSHLSLQYNCIQRENTLFHLEHASFHF